MDNIINRLYIQYVVSAVILLYACTVKPYDMLQAKNAVQYSVYHVTNLVLAQ